MMWQVIILAAIPVTELRFSIPAAVAMGMSPTNAFILSVIGNILPIGFLLVFLDPVFRFLLRVPFFKGFLGTILDRTRKKGRGVQEYGALGLLFFVALPLPGTGAWTGSLLAYLFGINIPYAFAAISSGVIAAGVLVTLATIGVLDLFSRGYSGIILIALVLYIGIVLYRRKNRKM
ncbi:MAG: ligand-binding protein SH3 [Clostridia bacterium]|nr:ligand-binding protein SH3 [Clostridia bacterium]